LSNIDKILDDTQDWAESLGLRNGPFTLCVNDSKVTAEVRSFRSKDLWLLGGMHGCVETFETYEELIEKSKIKPEDMADKVDT
jgi:hypothetical protein